MSSKLVLVTGISGFIAGHVAEQALAAGYRVRGTARGSKAKHLSGTTQVPGLEFVQVDDLASDNLDEALKGVDAIIHVASPLPGAANVDDTLSAAVKGTTNILEAAVKAGIEKVVVTSSFGSVMDPSMLPGFAGITFTGSEWGSVTVDEVRAKASDANFVYFASKVIAEKAVWEFAGKHSQLDVATVLPGFVYGPWSKIFPSPSKSGLGTNGLIYPLTAGGKPPLIPPFVVDVRDVGKSHVLALNVPSKPLEQKRYLVNGGNLTWKEAAELINSERSQLTAATSPHDVDAIPGIASKLDTKRAEEDLGIKEWITPKQTLLDTVDALITLQKTWEA